MYSQEKNERIWLKTVIGIQFGNPFIDEFNGSIKFEWDFS